MVEGLLDNHLALTAADSHAVVVIGNLVGLESWFLVTSHAVRVEAWDFVSVQSVHQALSFVGSNSPWDTIFRHNIDPHTRG